MLTSQILWDSANHQGAVQLRSVEQEVGQKAEQVEVVLVVDVSGSMEGLPLAMVLRATEYIAEALQGKAAVALVTFAASARVCFPLTPMCQDSTAECIQRTYSIVAGGGTNLAEGIRLGCEQFSRRADREYVVVLTDGKANHGRTDPRAIARLALEQLPSKHATLHVVGLGRDLDTDLLQCLVEQAHGCFHEADSEGQMVGRLGAVIGQILSVSCTGVVVTLPGRDLSGLADSSNRVTLGTFYQGETVTIPFEGEGAVRVQSADSHHAPHPDQIVDARTAAPGIVRVHLLRVRVGQMLSQGRATESDLLSLQAEVHRLQVEPDEPAILNLLCLRLQQALEGVEDLDRIARHATTELLRQQSQDVDLEDNPFLAPLVRQLSSQFSEEEPTSLQMLPLTRS